MQSAWRGYQCRLAMFAIGVLPLIRWTQIGSCFLPITYIRRQPTFHIRPDTTDGGKQVREICVVVLYVLLVPTLITFSNSS